MCQVQNCENLVLGDSLDIALVGVNFEQHLNDLTNIEVVLLEASLNCGV